MPGIVGVISQRPAEECERLVRSMVASMEHERFYSSGVFSVSELGFYTGWVTLETSLAANQPFLNEQCDVALISSGECFPDLQTLTELKQKGHEFKENKAAWLVHLYEEEGDQFFEKLNGVFSGFLIDKRQKKAFLFNDRYGGLERIYWCETKNGTYFASEAKALLRILPELREFDEEGVAQFLTFRCTFERRTLFRGISQLPGGSLWSFEAGNCCKKKFFSPGAWEAQSTLSPEHFQSAFEDTFKRILPRYFESEARIGISLTAGVDSRIIMACLPQSLPRPICYTFSGQERDTLDARLAARVAAACGLEHHTLRLEPVFFSEYGSHVDRTIYATDGYLGPLGAHEIYLNGQARHLAVTRLTGVFGGEVLREVSFLKPIRLSPRLLNGDLQRRLNSLGRLAVGNNQPPVTLAAFQDIPLKRFGPPAAARSQLTFRTPYLDNELVALAYRIPADLRCSTLPALQVITHNDQRLVDIPTDMGQMGRSRGLSALARRALKRITFKLDYFYNEGMPHQLRGLDPLLQTFNSRRGIFGLHKFLHYRRWFQRELAPYVSGILTDQQAQQSQFWNPAFLEHMTREHISGRRNYALEIDAVLTIEAIERLLFRSPSEPAGARKAHRAIAVSSGCTENTP
jgi:asparagine synthase (glutamine-hydrolysing)